MNFKDKLDYQAIFKTFVFAFCYVMLHQPNCLMFFIKKKCDKKVFYFLVVEMLGLQSYKLFIVPNNDAISRFTCHEIVDLFSSSF